MNKTNETGGVKKVKFTPAAVQNVKQATEKAVKAAAFKTGAKEAELFTRQGQGRYGNRTESDIALIQQGLAGAGVDFSKLRPDFNAIEAAKQKAIEDYNSLAA
ncbi:hypothetical protein FACS189421_02600 [Bacteroidia bacterium]|nr:hypothetical protein FACS189421_02600 [Bacteroidia bacterium]